MKRILILIISLLLLGANSAQAGRIVTDSIASRLLGATVKYNVYVPNGFGADGETYPMVYLLHGLTDDYRAWAEKGHMLEVVDELIGSGEACRMVIVMPCAGGPDIMNVWNGYLNMPGWPYEDFFFQEFMPEVERKFHAIGDKGHRAVMGLSMGGGGSTIYCQRHPELFSSCYAMSAWLQFDGENLYPKDSRPYLLQESMREQGALRYLEQADKATLDSLRTVSWFFDCGDDDFLFDLSVRMHQLMRSRHIKDELRIRNGVHNWEYWHQALRLALPFATRNFSNA